MRNVLLSIVLILFTLAAKGQGIIFQQDLNWDQIKTKAKASNKLIFIDVFATWCSPCKEMDKNVFTNSEVGDFFNLHFICIKIQADITPNDSQNTKYWYIDAKNIIDSNNIRILPTQLYLSPNGEIIDKSAGYKNVSELLIAANVATDPNAHYFSELGKYRMGKLTPTEIVKLAYRAKSIGEFKTADSIAQEYIRSYLYPLEEKLKLTVDNIKFIGDFLKDDKSEGFKYFYKNRDWINEVIGTNRADYVLRSAIARSAIPRTETWKIMKPNWDSIEKVLTLKYNQLGMEVLYGKKMYYYYMQKDWENFGKYYQLYFKTSLERPEFNVNNLSFEIFNNVDNQDVLNFACNVVMKYAMEEWYQNNIAAYDTYACLLYKTGQKEKGIYWEKIAIKAARGTSAEDEMKEVLNKMEAGEKIWKESIFK